MPKKTHRSKLKHKRANMTQPAAKEATLVQTLPVPSRTKTPLTTEEQHSRYRYVRSDVRRSLITAAVILIIFFILYIIFH